MVAAQHRTAAHGIHRLASTRVDGVTTGISAHDRARTARVLADSGDPSPRDLTRPGHVFPLRDREGGVLERRGHTEAAVDLPRSPASTPVGVHRRVGPRRRGDDAPRSGPRPRPTSTACVDHHRSSELVPTAGARPASSGSPTTTLPTVTATSRRRLPRRSPATSSRAGSPSAWCGDPTGVSTAARAASGAGAHGVPHRRRVRVAALRLRSAAGARPCARVAREAASWSTSAATRVAGSGSLDKLRAYEMQDGGADTVDAQTALGLPVDARDYGAGARDPARPRRRLGAAADQQPRQGSAGASAISVVDDVAAHPPPRRPRQQRLPAHQARPARPLCCRSGLDDHDEGRPAMSGAGKRHRRSPSDASGLRVAVVAASLAPAGDGRPARRGAARARDVQRRATSTWSACPARSSCPVACARLAPSYDALVALGVVIRGGTPHFDYVCPAATHGLTEVSVAHRHPGRLRRAHLRHRAPGARPGRPAGSGEDKGYEAATAAVATAVTLRDAVPR